MRNMAQSLEEQQAAAVAAVKEQAKAKFAELTAKQAQVCHPLRNRVLLYGAPSADYLRRCRRRRTGRRRGRRRSFRNG